MEPVDLRTVRPRSPYVALAGIVSTARAIDKLRAEVSAAETEARVIAWIDARLDANVIDRARCPERLRAVRSADVPEDWRPVSDAVYSAELPERHPLLFGLLEADDERLSATGAAHRE